MSKRRIKEPLFYSPSLLDVATLLVHVRWGAQDDEVGFEDADRTLDQMTRTLNKKTVSLRKEVLESALWSCNLLNEKGQFWSPLDETFQEFINRLLKPHGSEFDEFYNWINDPREAPPKTWQAEEE